MFSVADRDHSQHDALAVILMSHGGLNEWNNREFIWVYDGKVDTSILWKNFTAEKCPTLAGKPKIFFIQVCFVILKSRLSWCLFWAHLIFSDNSGGLDGSTLCD